MKKEKERILPKNQLFETLFHVQSALHTIVSYLILLRNINEDFARNSIINNTNGGILIEMNI